MMFHSLRASWIAILLVPFVMSSCGKVSSPNGAQSFIAAKEMIDDNNDPKKLHGNTVPFEMQWKNLPKMGEIESVWKKLPSWSFNTNGIAHHKGKGMSPTEKYDTAFNGGERQATNWEILHHGRAFGLRLQSWWAGHCNGFAAAAVNVPEPVKDVTYNGVVFGPEDLKALLGEAFFESKAEFIGLRCNNLIRGKTLSGRYLDSTCRDVNAGSFHLAVTNLIGMYQKPIVIDTSASNVIWNAPIRSFRILEEEIVSAEEANDLIRHAFGDNSVYRYNDQAVHFVRVKMRVEYVYTKLERIDYRYVLELDAAGNIIGGEWLDGSKTTHPDFLWYTAQARSANPYIDPVNVLMLAQHAY